MLSQQNTICMGGRYRQNSDSHNQLIKLLINQPIDTLNQSTLHVINLMAQTIKHVRNKAICPDNQTTNWSIQSIEIQINQPTDTFN